MENRDALIIHGKEHDLGGFSVHRALPFFKKRSIGPFVFIDHMGPMKIDESHLLSVRPHPHIGLATVTYLFEGRGFHRDSLGSQQIINPGDLNWMTAGRGIAHSERTPNEERDPQLGRKIHGMQIWVGLPREQEECEPNFTHWPKEIFPLLTADKGTNIKVLLGSFQGERSPVSTYWSTLFLDIKCPAEAKQTFSFTEEEIGFFVAEGICEIDGQQVNANDLIVVGNPQSVAFKALTPCRVVVVGGKPFPEPRFIWWNFVSSSKERIRQAAADWKAGKFGQVPGETDFIPLPEIPLP